MMTTEQKTSNVSFNATNETELKQLIRLVQFEASKLKVKQDGIDLAHTLSKPSKMPCSSYSLPTEKCHVGSTLRQKENSTCSGCYAHETGFYVMPSTIKALSIRYNKMDTNLFKWTVGMVHNIKYRTGDKDYFRWHDSGDIDNYEHAIALLVIARIYKDVKFWIPTREYATYNKYKLHVPANVTVRVSAAFVNQVLPDHTYKITSSVITIDKTEAYINKNVGVICPATIHGNSMQCEAHKCRKCWDKNIRDIAYIKH